MFLLITGADGPPLDCKHTKFGCCWDNKTVAKGKYQEGCPACKDRYVAECKAFVKQCGREDIRRICPQTCGVPCSKSMIYCSAYLPHSYSTMQNLPT